MVKISRMKIDKKKIKSGDCFGFVPAVAVDRTHHEPPPADFYRFCKKIKK